MLSISGFLAHFRRQREWTRRIALAIPDDKFDWTPSEDSFSCGDTLRHLIQAEVFWRRLLVKASQGEAYDPFGLTGDSETRLIAFRRPNLTASRDDTFGASVEECLDRWAEVQEKTEEMIATIPDESLHNVTMKHETSALRG